MVHWSPVFITYVPIAKSLAQQIFLRLRYVFAKNREMTSIGAIFTSTYHSKQLNPWPNSLASRVVIHNQLSACQEKMGPFKGHPSTGGHQTGLKKGLS